MKWMILISTVMFCAGTSRAEGPCDERCGRRLEKCQGAVQKVQTKCDARAEGWKATAEKKAAKAKDPAKAREKLQARYEKMKQACAKKQGRATDRCTKANQRCTKGCLAKAKPAKKQLPKAKSKTKAKG